MHCKNILSIILAASILTLSFTSCSNPDKKGVDYLSFPDKETPTFDDTKVSNLDEDDNDIQDPSSDEKNYSDDTACTPTELVSNKDKSTEISKNQYYDIDYYANCGEIWIECNNYLIQAYLDNEFIGKTESKTDKIKIDGKALENEPHDLLIEVMDENNQVFSKQNLDKVMFISEIYLDYKPFVPTSEKYKDAKCLLIEYYSYTAFADLTALSELTNLEYLSLCGQINDISPLSSLTNLKYLSIDGYMADISSISALTNLEYLYLAGHFTDINAVSSLPKLKSLYLYGYFESIIPISSLTDLHYLELEGYFTDINPISSLTSLETLYLFGYYTDITSVSSLTNLDYLSLFGCEDISSVSSLTNLKTLHLSGDFTDISALSYLSDLEYLELSGDYSDISALSSLTNLKDITLHGRFEDINALSHLTKLTEAYISNSDNKSIDFSVLDDLGVEYH